MTISRPRIAHHIQVYQVDEQYYVTGMIQLSNLSWKSMAPVEQVSKSDLKSFEKAIEVARMRSRPLVKDSPDHESNRLWDGNGGMVWKNTSKLWSIRWYIDGTVLIAPYSKMRPLDDPELADGSGWRRNRDAEEVLGPPVTTSAIVQRLME
ncbi:MAG: hypothetical protein HYZ49_05875 [Chloroflexi bacterium]|nr:hypothetical protein [Chloroflexota bacterium]